MVAPYADVIKTSKLGHLYKLDLSGPPVATGLRADVLWRLHRRRCDSCRQPSFPEDWDTYRPLNATNPCHISHMLSWVWYGWLPAFSEMPPPTGWFYPNSSSIDAAPIASRKDHDKILAMGASSVGFSPYINPVISVVKDTDLITARELLSPHGLWSFDIHIKEVDAINATIDKLSHLLPAVNPIKARTCVDYSRILNLLTHLWEFRQTTVQDALSLLRRGSFMAKLDVSRQFHQIRLHPAARQFFAYRYKDADGVPQTYIPNSTPMGFSPIPGLANTLMSEVSAILTFMGIPNVIMSTYTSTHLQLTPPPLPLPPPSHLPPRSSFPLPLPPCPADDIFIAGDTEEECRIHMQRAIDIVSSLGWELNTTKTEGPAQKLTFLGVQINTTTLTLDLERTRLEAYLKSVNEILAKRVISAHDLQRLAGKLQWLSGVFTQGRTHLSQIYGFVSFLTKQGLQEAAPTAALVQELLYWRHHLTLMLQGPHPGFSRFWSNSLPEPLHIYSDASGEDLSDTRGMYKTGFGATCNGIVYQGTWKLLKHKSSAYAELVPLLLILQHQGPHLRNRVLLVTTDNMSNAYAINRGGGSASKTSKAILQQIFDLASSLNIGLIAQWIPRQYNQFMDDLSKWVPQIQVAF